MNPPSAIHGAMGRERKPFTYTPGGLDLSEIKSERMAKRLMRNAMNQGVPEQPQTIQSPPLTPSTPLAVPNYNCLPVQVFPTFNLPANPKSLLRTRSTPDSQKEAPPLRVPPLSQHLPSQIVNSFKPSGVEQLRETVNMNNTFSQVNNHSYNNSRPATLLEYSAIPTNDNNFTRNNYGSDGFTTPNLPEICYDAEICNVSQIIPQNTVSAHPVINEHDMKSSSIKESYPITSDFTIKPIIETISIPEPVIKPDEDNAMTDVVDDEQKEVKVVKKQAKKEKKIDGQNGEQNGDTNAEAEMTIKLPSKKSAAKTETKVEVVKKTLPDGSVEEVKTTTTRTTIDGRTEIKTKTETTIIPKQDDVEEIEEEEEEEASGDQEAVVQEVEENGEEEIVEEPKKVVVKKTVQETPANETNKIIKQQEKSETTTTKKVIVVQKSNKPEEEAEEEEEEEEDTEPEPVIVKKPPALKPQPPPKEEPTEVEEEEEEEEEEEVVVDKKVEIDEKPPVSQVVKKQVEVEEPEEAEDEEVEEVKVKKEVKAEAAKEEPKEAEVEVEEEEEIEEAEEQEVKEEKVSEVKLHQPTQQQPAALVKENDQNEDDESEYTEEEIEPEKEESTKPPPAEEAKVTPKEEPASEEPKQEEKKEVQQEQRPPKPEQPQPREPSIPLDKVEEVEIKPIGLVSKTQTESTEITTSNDKPSGILSTQTEYNRIENFVTVNRTTKTLDHSYEQLTQQGIPTVKTYFAPDRERVSTSPQPAKPYQPMYPSQPQQQQERRHSLLLERLSTERQMPSEIYQNQLNNQSYEQQRQGSQDPQSEIIIVSNVKPSMITNQQWYQQNRKDNILYNNVLPSTPSMPAQQWSQPPPQPPSQLQYQTSYNENTTQDTSRISNTYQQQNSYQSYTPKPSNWAAGNLGSTLPSVNEQPTQYSLPSKDSSEPYQIPMHSSSYVPPPWEQDPSYVPPEIPTQNYYQTLSPTNTFGPSSKPGWKPAPPPGKFTKPVSRAYVPPAPNQSFVKTAIVADLPKLPGRKTYYSEYERRFITVPESTYIPSETKVQPQPDASPQYYYDNNEPNETVEHQWRKELREFTEKTSQTLPQTELTSVKPPWEEDAKYAKVPTVTYTPTPSWSQTLRPQSYRERSFESEYVGSNEWSKTNTLGRGRPLSSYANVDATIPERPRGVSVDRYNPNNYQSPISTEHAPVQTHTLTPTITPAKGYHNPNVPAYHARASAEPREHPVPIPQARNWGVSRAAPNQSRSFKYLQWITGTED